MNKKIVILALVSVLLLSGFLPVVMTDRVLRPDNIIVATVGVPLESVDPAWAYYSSSQELIFNVYDRLMSFDVDRTLPPEEQGKTDRFVPALATEWTVSPNGLRVTFKIREGVKFHNGATLTPADVEYSFERAMVQDSEYGPVWMFYEHLLGTFSSRPFSQYPGNETGLATLIDNAIQSNGTHVWFNLVKPYLPFLSILAQSYGSIVNKAFCIEHGDWNGTWFWSGGNWTEYNNPEISPLDTGGGWTCGTGPYWLDYWNYEDGTWSFVKFDDYWGGWPASNCDGHVDRVTVIDVTSLLNTKSWWPFVVQPFLDGDIDILRASARYLGDLQDYPGVRCIKNLPLLTVYAMLLNFNNVTEGWPFVLPPGTFDESGFPSDLFSDVDARKGFAYSFNYTSYIEEAFYAGEAIQLTCPCPVQLYYNPAQPGYSLNSSKAEEHFRTAWGGELWSEGFTITLMYNTGNELQRIAYEMLKANVENLNPKFHIYVEERPPWMVWPSPGPVFCIGWFFDVPEPYDFFSAFMYSLWGLAEYQGYNSTVVDELIEEGKHTLNQTRRREILDELQAIYFNECPSVPLGQHYKRNYQRDWIQGWYYNPAYPGEYFYHLWKGYLGDTEPDGDVDIDDLGNVLLGWPDNPLDPTQNIAWSVATYGVPWGTDIDHDNYVDTDDLGWVLWNYDGY